MTWLFLRNFLPSSRLWVQTKPTHAQTVARPSSYPVSTRENTPFNGMQSKRTCTETDPMTNNLTISRALIAFHVRKRRQNLVIDWTVCFLPRSCHTPIDPPLTPTYRILPPSDCFFHPYTTLHHQTDRQATEKRLQLKNRRRAHRKSTLAHSRRVELCIRD